MVSLIPGLGFLLLSSIVLSENGLEQSSLFFRNGFRRHIQLGWDACGGRCFRIDRLIISVAYSLGGTTDQTRTFTYDTDTKRQGPSDRYLQCQPHTLLVL